MTARVVNILMLVLLLATPAMAQPSGCPYDADGDGRVDIEDLYHLTQTPADINGDGIADAEDTRCLEAYLRCIERLDMSFRPGEPAADGNVPSLSYRASGTSQVMRVVREPSPDGLGCVSQAWTTTLLGTRAGLTGPVEIRLDRDGFLWQSLFADASATSPGTTARRGMLTCDGSGVEFVASSPAMTVASSSETRALVLLHGQNITDAAVAKGVEDAAARSIGGGLIDAYTDIDGNVTLPTRGVLVLFELDAGDQSNPSFAFDDAVLLVDVECGDISDDSPQVFVLRDSIGPDDSMLGTFIVPNDDGPESDVQAVFELAGGTDGYRVVRVEFIHDNGFPFFPMDWSLVEFEFRLWRTIAEVNASAETGTLADFPVFMLENPPPVYFDDAAETRRLITIDLSQVNVQIPPGSTRYFAIPQVNAGIFSSGFVGIVESTEAGSSDYWRSGQVIAVNLLPGSEYDGRLALRIFVESLP